MWRRLGTQINGKYVGNTYKNAKVTATVTKDI